MERETKMAELIGCNVNNWTSLKVRIPSEALHYAHNKTLRRPIGKITF